MRAKPSLAHARRLEARREEVRAELLSLDRMLDNPDITPLDAARISERAAQLGRRADRLRSQAFTAMREMEAAL